MKPMRLLILLTAAAALAVSAGCGDGDEGPGEAQPPEMTDSEDGDTALATPSEIDVHFVSPADGARVTSPVEVEMAAEGVDVVPAGTMEEGTGHMHILVDTPFVAPGEVIPSDDRHIHYGDGSTTATLELEPGEHVLRMQLADGAHRAFEGDEYRDVVRIEVEDGESSGGGNDGYGGDG